MSQKLSRTWNCRSQRTQEDKDVAYYESIQDKMVISKESFGKPNNKQSNTSTPWGILEQRTSDWNYNKMTSLTRTNEILKVPTAS